MASCDKYDYAYPLDYIFHGLLKEAMVTVYCINTDM
jgi:hypothetical protein